MAGEDQMCQYEELPTVTEASFDITMDAHDLRKAMKGFGTDEEALINILCRRTNVQRLYIAKAYQICHGRDLLKDIKSETSGRFREVLNALLTPHLDYLAKSLHDAMAGIGTNENILIDILCTASTQELRFIQETYFRIYQKTLVQDIVSDTSSYFQKTLLSLCTEERCCDATINWSAVVMNATALYEEGIKKWGTNESVFINILTTRSYSHLREVFKHYQKIAGEDIEKSIKSEFSGYTEDALLAIVKCTKNRSTYFAERLRYAMKGLGTNDELLILLIIGRSEIDLDSIKREYQRLYGKPLSASVHSETSGDYRKALLTLIGNDQGNKIAISI